MEVSWLIDKSALVRLGASPDAETWADRIGRGLVSITTVTLLEVGYSARTARELRTASSEPPLSLMPVEYLKLFGAERPEPPGVARQGW